MEGAKILKVLMAAVIAAAVFLQSVSAATVVVGGSTGWDLSTNFTQWSASSAPIFVNDTLLFNYTLAHNVIEVSEAGFGTCNASSATVAAYDDGLTMVNLTKPGLRYFVCGRSNHCSLGHKLQVRVLDRPQLAPDTTSHDTNSGSGDTTDDSRPRPDPALAEQEFIILVFLLLILACHS